jgi:hypothetical protein
MQRTKKILVMTASLLLLSSCSHDLVFEPMDAITRLAYNVYVVPDSKEPLTDSETSQEPPPEATIIIVCEHPDTANWPNPFIVTYTDIRKKEAYIRNVKEILKLFRLIAHDTIRRKEFLSAQELACQTDKYISVYVQPIMSDSEANNSLETKLEIATLHVLCALLHHDMARDDLAELHLDELRELEGNDASLLDVRIDPADIGFITLRAAMRDLEARSPVSTENN